MRAVTRRGWMGFCFLALVVGVASAQTTGMTQSAGTLEDQVKAAQQKLLEASRQDDKAAAGRLLADDLTWVDMTGKVRNKSELLAMENRKTPTEVHVDQVKLVGNTAVATGVARFDDGHESRFVQEWVNRSGEWQVFAHQGTLVGGAPSSMAPTGTSGTRGMKGARGTTGSNSAASRTSMKSMTPALSSDAERAVWKTNNDLTQAFLRGDSVRYGKLTADGYIRVDPNGNLQSKSDYLQTVKLNAGRSAGRIDNGDAQVKVNGDTARVITTFFGTLPGGTELPLTRMTRIFALNNGQWQQVAAIFTPVQEQ